MCYAERYEGLWDDMKRTCQLIKNIIDDNFVCTQKIPHVYTVVKLGLATVL